MTALLEWPPPYTVRYSQRAKRIGLKMTPHRGLELVLPPRGSLAAALAFLNAQRAWIQAHWNPEASSPVTLQWPLELQLQAIAKTLKVLPIDSKRGSRSFKLIEGGEGDPVILVGPFQSPTPPGAVHGLKNFLFQKAQEHFEPQLFALSRALHFPLKKVGVRWQKTRWGSCSTSGTVHLNAGLLFLPPPIVRYVMIHELCHLRHQNHSSAFWKLVSTYDPAFQQHRKDLARGHHWIPGWLQRR